MFVWVILDETALICSRFGAMVSLGHLMMGCQTSVLGMKENMEYESTYTKRLQTK